MLIRVVVVAGAVLLIVPALMLGVSGLFDVARGLVGAAAMEFASSGIFLGAAVGLLLNRNWGRLAGVLACFLLAAHALRQGFQMATALRKPGSPIADDPGPWLFGLAVTTIVFALPPLVFAAVLLLPATRRAMTVQVMPGPGRR
jgi:hypothetical protein